MAEALSPKKGSKKSAADVIPRISYEQLYDKHVRKSPDRLRHAFVSFAEEHNLGEEEFREFGKVVNEWMVEHPYLPEVTGPTINALADVVEGPGFTPEFLPMALEWASYKNAFLREGPSTLKDLQGLGRIVNSPKFRKDFSLGVLENVEQSGYPAREVFGAFRRFVEVPGFRPEWIDKYWEPSFERILKETSREEGRFALAIAKLLLLNGNLKPQKLEATLPRIISEVREVNDMGIEEATSAFGFLSLRDDFSLGHIDKYWKPLARHIMEKETGDERKNAFKSLEDIYFHWQDERDLELIVKRSQMEDKPHVLLADCVTLHDFDLFTRVRLRHGDLHLDQSYDANPTGYDEHDAIKRFLDEGKILPEPIEDMQNPQSLSFIIEHGNEYNALFAEAREYKATGEEFSDYEMFISEHMALGKLREALAGPAEYYDAERRLESMTPLLANRLIDEYPPDMEWFKSDPSRDAEEMLSVAGILRIMSIMYSGKWDTIYKDVLEEMERNGIVEEYLEGIPVARSADEMDDLFSKFESLRKMLDPGTFNMMFSSKVDFDSVFGKFLDEGFDIGKIEELRLRVNTYSQTMGDEFIYMLGSYISQQPITRETIRKRADIARQFMSRPSRHTDVDPLYALVGRFQANKLAKFVSKDDDLKSEWNEYFVKNFGIELTGESNLSKIPSRLRQRGVGYVFGRAWDKLTPTEALRGEILLMDLGKSPGHKMADGFECEFWSSGGKKVATVVKLTDPGKGGVAYFASPGRGISDKAQERMYGKKMVARSIASYTTGERKIAELAAVDGWIVNYLISEERDGIVFVLPDGSVNVGKAGALRVSDMGGGGKGTLKIRHKQEDFLKFMDVIRRTRASVFMGHLLIYDGKLDIDPEKSKSSHAKRREFAIFKDGSYGIIDFDNPISLAEAAVLARKMGAMDMVNLDTGMYDYSMYKDRSGKMHKLGQFDSVNPTNLIFFLTK